MKESFQTSYRGSSFGMCETFLHHQGFTTYERFYVFIQSNALNEMTLRLCSPRHTNPRAYISGEILSGRMVGETF